MRQRWIRDVALYLSGQTLSMFGSSVVAYAIIWHVTLKTGSGGQYSLLLIASQLSMAVTMIPGGVWADRHWRKALMIGADAVVALATIGLAVFMLNGFENLWLIAGALVIRGLGGGIQHPAANAALPQIAPADKLMRINSIFQSIQSLVFIAAPALAAVMLVYIPLGWILMVDVVTAVLGIGCTLAVRIPRLETNPDQPPPEGLRGYVSHIGEAVRYAGAIPGLRRVALLGLVILIIVIPFAQMTPVFVVRLFGDANWMLAAVEMVWSIGMILGGLAIAAWGGFKNRMSMIMMSCIIISIMTMAMGFAPNIWVFLLVMVVSGLAMPMWNTPTMTAIQELIPTTMMGRVISFYGLISSLGGPIGMAIIGPVSDHLNISWMALVCGGIGLLILIALALRGGPGSRLLAPEQAVIPTDDSEPAL